jgi:DNA-binding LytR/AlgR family response regulator
MSVSCIIVDDEYLAIKVLSAYASGISTLQVLKTFTDSRAAVAFIQQQPVDLILLDIQMPYLSGFDLVKALPQEAMVIFTTARHDFAVQAYELDVLDYLVKPISQERFEKAIQKALEFKQYRTVWNEQKTAARNFLMIKSDYRIIKLLFDDIEYIEGLSEYVKIYGREKTHTTLAALKSLESELPADKFIRVHKSYIVALSAIDQFNSRTIQLHNGKELPIGRSYKDPFLQKMKGQ